ncbi:efflux RND transporter periplasmic adaptor subunit [Aliarcobacter butzleri]|uniref:HlyD family secretion protein n=1 Tax=Aliarcobacter butzleri TaxID=28197 RepID=UPI001EDA8860|nr:efflux RND transporter periplasmic adaptor subunit [Aliarcobacter butzleri]MCG3686911.1 efflux RND transporter periplasmic adaptor subunit [Aliarcobacter butzleri]MCT7631253.1 efflux RND transporter periplasmic adaptor subunit [Aliarcobacter butzleri]
MLKKSILLFTLLAIGVGIYFYLFVNQKSDLSEGFAVGNGRVETTQVDVASKLSGRLIDIDAEEGDLVQKDEILAHIDTKELNAKLQEAMAYEQQAIENKNYALAIVEEKQSQLSLAKKDYDRANSLYKTKSIPLAEFQKYETAFQTQQAALTAAKSQVISSQSTINATSAQIETIKVNIEDSKLYSPVKGRVLYKIAENGEIVANGGKVLVVLDLLNTYMTIFLPTSQAGLVDIGSEARIVLDAIPNIAIPAHVTFVSPLAQFTPKEIETQAEREKLMFRIKVKIDSNVLEKYFDRIKTGLPGVAYIKLDKNVSWPDYLNNLPKKVSE